MRQLLSDTTRSMAARTAALLEGGGLADALLGSFSYPDAATALGPDVWPAAQQADAAIGLTGALSSENLPAPRTVVRLRGLEAKPELNGVVGTVAPRALWPDNGRVPVQLEQESTALLSLKPQNMERVEGEPGPNVRACVVSSLTVCANLMGGIAVGATEAARVAVAKRLGPVLAVLTDDRRTLFGSHMLWRDAFYRTCSKVLEQALRSGDIQGVAAVPPTAKNLLLRKHGNAVRRSVALLLFYRPFVRSGAPDDSVTALASGIECLMELVEMPHGFNKGRAKLDDVVALCATPDPESGTPLAVALPALVVSCCVEPAMRLPSDAWASLGFAYHGLYWCSGGDARLVTREVAQGFASAINAELDGECVRAHVCVCVCVTSSPRCPLCVRAKTPPAHTHAHTRAHTHTCSYPRAQGRRCAAPARRHVQGDRIRRSVTQQARSADGK
jgi:hypothetical protein